MFVSSKAQHVHHFLVVGAPDSLITDESPTAGMPHVTVGIATCLSEHLLNSDIASIIGKGSFSTLPPVKNEGKMEGVGRPLGQHIALNEPLRS